MVDASPSPAAAHPSDGASAAQGAHVVTLGAEPLPDDVPAGSDLHVTLSAACSAGCDLRGAAVEVRGADGVLATCQLAAGDDDMAYHADVTLPAPRTVAQHTLTLTMLACEAGGVAHAETSLPIGLATIPHGTSLAVWGTPTAVITGEPFKLTVGAKSASGCNLAGSEIAVCDAAGAIVARGRLRDTPWPDTAALYWTELESVAPEREGVHVWTARFAAPAVDLPHEGSSTGFSFATTRRPQHSLAVTVTEKETQAPVEKAIVRVGSYRAETDAAGRAELKVPGGEHEVLVWKAGYDVAPQPLEVNADAAIAVEAVKLPEDNPDTYWTM